MLARRTTRDSLAAARVSRSKSLVGGLCESRDVRISNTTDMSTFGVPSCYCSIHGRDDHSSRVSLISIAISSMMSGLVYV